MELMEEQRTRRAAAASACRVMAPVARRKLRKEIVKACTNLSADLLLQQCLRVMLVWHMPDHVPGSGSECQFFLVLALKMFPVALSESPEGTHPASCKSSHLLIY